MWWCIEWIGGTVVDWVGFYGGFSNCHLLCHQSQNGPINYILYVITDKMVLFGGSVVWLYKSQWFEVFRVDGSVTVLF